MELLTEGLHKKRIPNKPKNERDKKNKYMKIRSFGNLKENSISETNQNTSFEFFKQTKLKNYKELSKISNKTSFFDFSKSNSRECFNDIPQLTHFYQVYSKDFIDETSKNENCSIIKKYKIEMKETKSHSCLNHDKQVRNANIITGSKNREHFKSPEISLRILKTNKKIHDNVICISNDLQIDKYIEKLKEVNKIS